MDPVRDQTLERLAKREFDLLVIGGGIYGAWTAYDAALRGLDVALIERDDWAAGTSSSSSKLIHGGLRYLENLHLGLVRKALVERARLARLAPHRVRPLRFVIPQYLGDRVSPRRLRLGLLLYDAIAAFAPMTGFHRSHDRAAMLSDYPFLTGDGLLSGASYGDAQTDDARLVLELVSGAMAAGASAATRLEAVALLKLDGKVRAAAVRDHETGKEIEIRATLTVGAVGPYLASLGGVSLPPTRRTKGVHLVMPALPTEHAFTLTAKSDGRVFFLLPWYGRTLLGTTDTDFHDDPVKAQPSEDDIGYLLDGAARFVTPAWKRDDVIASFSGLRTLLDAPGTQASSLRRDWILHEPLPGLLAPIGGKLTSARVDAATTVDRAFALLGRKTGKSPTATKPLPWSPPADLTQWMMSAMTTGVRLGLDIPTAHDATLRQGSAVERLHRTLEKDVKLGRRLHLELAFARAEIAVAAEHEHATRLIDIVRRRLPMVLLARAAEPWLDDAGAIAASVLGWSEERTASEVAAVRSVYG